LAQRVSVRLRRLVVERARNRCDAGDNLTLACVSCSLRKAARETAVDPTSGERVALFHPRRDLWHDHFHWQGARLFGRAATGRATIEALEMNRHLMIAIRQEESAEAVIRRLETVVSCRTYVFHCLRSSTRKSWTKRPASRRSGGFKCQPPESPRHPPARITS